MLDGEDHLRLVLDLVDRHAGGEREQIERGPDRELSDVQRVQGDIAVFAKCGQGSNERALADLPGTHEDHDRMDAQLALDGIPGKTRQDGGASLSDKSIHIRNNSHSSSE